MTNRVQSAVAIWVSAVATAAYLVWVIRGFAHPKIFPIWAAGISVGFLWSLTFVRRAESTSYKSFLRQTADVHLLMVALLLGLALQQVANEGITSDGCIYFAHLRSLIFDGDLEIGRELRVLGLPPRPSHVVTFGAAIVWAPFYLVVRMVDLLGQSAGMWFPGSNRTAGLTGAYARAALVPSYLIAAAGLTALHLRLRREFGGSTALVSSLLIFGATPVAWYAIYEPAMAHAASFGLVALFLVASEAWVDRTGTSPTRGVMLGALLGMIVLVRPQDGLFGIFPVTRLLFTDLTRRDQLTSLARMLGAIALGAAPFVVGQLVVVRLLMAAQPFKLVGDGGYLHVFDSRWLDVLFSSWHGFLSWTPVAYFALAGTVMYVRRDRRWAVAALIVFAAMSWVNGSADDWWGGWAFGGRRFASTVAALGPGLATLILWARSRPLALLAPVAAGALAWNSLLMLQYHHERLPRNEPIGFDRLVRQQAEMYTERPYVYPFAFPANIWFAWRQGVPIDRYDLLSPEPFLPRIVIRLDERADRFLLDGWSRPEASEHNHAEPFSWLTAREGTVVVPLDPPRAPPPALELEARADGQVEMAIEIDVNGTPLGRVILDSTRKTVAPPTMPTETRRQIWRRGYNRVALRKVGPVTLRSSDVTARGGGFGVDGPRIAVYAIRIEPRPVGATSR